MYNFDAKKVTKELIEWIKVWFNENGKGCNAVIGISGGKDSSVVAALCVKALGRKRVIGVLMPNGEQADIDMAYKLCKHLDIKHHEINIRPAVASLQNEIMYVTGENLSKKTRINLPPRIRMTTLYAIAQTYNGRVMNTCNFSETQIGWETKFGDSVGDCSPLGNLTVQEVKAIGRELGLPEELIEKVPSDGLCSKTDEDAFGFTYETLDRYIREGIEPEDKAIKEKIDSMIKGSEFKRNPIPTFTPTL